MGKTRPKKFGFRPTPTGIASTGGASADLGVQTDSQTGETTSSALNNIVEKLQAPSVEERACGCKILASVVSQPTALGQLLNMNVVRIVSSLFIDPCLDVRKSALGALRNMTVFGHADVCDFMISHDVLTPLIAVLREYGNNWTPPKETLKYDTATEVLVESVELLANLSEMSAVAVRWFNTEKILAILLPLLKVETYGYLLSNAVARCLHVVSENNPEVTSTLCQPAVFVELCNIVSARQPGIDHALFRTLITGIVLNLPDVDLSQHYKGIVSSIVDALDINLQAAIESAMDGQHQTEEEMNYDPELAWPTVDNLLNAQGLSLEFLANLCCADGEWEDVDGIEESSSSDDQATEQESADVDMAGDANESLCLSGELNSAFLENHILAKILQVASPANDPLMKRLEGSQTGKTTLTKLSQLRQRSLLCLGNFLEAVDEAFLSSSGTSLAEMWAHIYKLARTDTEGSDIKWATTSALRAVIQRIATSQPLSPCDMSESDLDFLTGLTVGCEDAEVQINVLKIISTLGCIMTQLNQRDDIVKKIGAILLEVSVGSQDLVVVSEALDSLFDVFKEDHTDGIAREISLVEKLRALQPAFKAKISSQKKKLGSNLGIVMMAKTNLNGFIKYKLSQR